MNIISPSLLACDFLHIEDELKKIENGGADWAHIDVMDGIFVPNISIGLPIVEAMRKASKLVFDVHLMIDEPIRYVKSFADAGADYITVHYEACSDVQKTLNEIKATGKKVGLSIKPNTEASVIFPYIKDCDLILVMTVEPGYGGQKLIPETLPKVKEISQYIAEQGLNCLISVDGGIKEENAYNAVSNGANVLVAGSSVFHSTNVEETITKLKNI